MKFAQNGYYIKKYVKCANCCVLIDEQSAASHQSADSAYSTQWCVEWTKQKAHRVENPIVSIAFDAWQKAPEIDVH